jgi:hypothetical protein
MPGPISDTYQGPDDHLPWTECWQCNGTGLLAGCFEDTCSGADCDPEDPELCCSPSRCDVCRGHGGWDPDESSHQSPEGGR